MREDYKFIQKAIDECADEVVDEVIKEIREEINDKPSTADIVIAVLSVTLFIVVTGLVVSLVFL